jgi:hypothetical protein
MTVFGAVPVDDLRNVINFIKDRNVALKVFLKSLTNLVSFLIDLVPEGNLQEFKAQGHKDLSETKLLEILESLGDYKVASATEGVPVWVIPVLLKLLDLLQIYLRG